MSNKISAVIHYGKKEMKTTRKHTKSQWAHRYAVSKLWGKLITKNGKTNMIQLGIGVGVCKKTSNGTKKNIPDTVDTVDWAIREKNIFTALSKIPAEVQKTLLANGWIEKKTKNVAHNHPIMIVGPKIIVNDLNQIVIYET